jgi:hypothetical protein
MKGAIAASGGMSVAVAYAATMAAFGLMCPPVALSAIVPFWLTANAIQKSIYGDE